MSSQQQRFKTLLIRDKQWLGELYLATNILQSNRILNFATDTKLDTLIRYFHFLSNGAIKIKAASFESIRKSHISYLYSLILFYNNFFLLLNELTDLLFF